MKSEDKCPKCGVGTLTQKHGLWRWWSCGTNGNLAHELSESPTCFRSQLHADRAEAERLSRQLVAAHVDTDRAAAKIIELESQLATARAEAERLKEELLNLTAINVANPGSHVTNVIRERDAARAEALRYGAALDSITRRSVIMGSTGKYRRGQTDALEACASVARAALLPPAEPTMGEWPAMTIVDPHDVEWAMEWAADPVATTPALQAAIILRDEVLRLRVIAGAARKLHDAMTHIDCGCHPDNPCYGACSEVWFDIRNKAVDELGKAIKERDYVR